MVANDSIALFRFWSPTSAGGLESGKLHHNLQPYDLTEADLDREFSQHRNLYSVEPTALVSTTSNFLRALHGTFRKISEGEDAQQVKIAFLTTGPNFQAKIRHAQELAIRRGGSKDEATHFEHEYLFLWKISDEHITHIVSMDLVLRRGFTLGPEISESRPFPDVTTMRQAIANQGNELPCFERGYLCSLAACTFGLRGPVHEVAFQMSRWVHRGTHCRKGWEIVDRAIHETILDTVATVAEDLDTRGDVRLLKSELDFLENMHNENIAEIGWMAQKNPQAESSLELLTREELNITRQRQKTACSVEIAYQSAGF